MVKYFNYLFRSELNSATNFTQTAVEAIYETCTIAPVAQKKSRRKSRTDGRTDGRRSLPVLQAPPKLLAQAS